MELWTAALFGIVAILLAIMMLGIGIINHRQVRLLAGVADTGQFEERVNSNLEKIEKLEHRLRQRDELTQRLEARLEQLGKTMADCEDDLRREIGRAVRLNAVLAEYIMGDKDALKRNGVSITNISGPAEVKVGRDLTGGDVAKRNEIDAGGDVEMGFDPPQKG